VSPEALYQPGSIRESAAFVLTGVPLKHRTFILSALLLAAAPFAAHADQLVPAGTVLKCTVSDQKISSKTLAVGDPVLCNLGHTDAAGRVTFPFGSYLEGRFVDYKDPGHFVGKGWMELRFEKLYIQPDTTVPLNARVVATPKYPVDADGKIHGTGHAVRDTVEWLIPVLWPIDLINLPRRGPRPELKAETQLTLKVIDDFGIPSQIESDYRQPALIERRAAAIEKHKENMVDQGYMTADEAFGNHSEAAPVQRNYVPQQYAPQPVYQQQPQYAPQPQPVYQSYAAPQPQVIVVQAPQPTIIQQAAPVVVQQQAPVVVHHSYYPPPPPYGYYHYYGPY